jgi:hypothetical protein
MYGTSGGIMTKIMMILCLVILASCAHQRGPASIGGNPVAYDSMALGNVKASAVKRVSNQEVCFDINLQSKDVTPEQAKASNWTLAWVDNQNQFHPIPTTQRDPASAPQGGAVVAPYGAYTEYSNDFTSCVPKAQFDNVKGIVLTPKELPYAKKDGLQLNWN